MNDFKLTISSLIIYTLDMLLIFRPCSFTTIAIILKLKKLFTTPISLEVFSKVHFLHWNPMGICLKSAKFSHFSLFVFYFSPRDFFYQIYMYENYRKQSPNGEIKKIVYLVVWSMDNIKVDFFSPKLA